MLTYFTHFLSLLKKPINKEIKLVNALLLQIILLISLIFVLFLFFWIKRGNRNVRKEVLFTQQEYINSQKENIKNETDRAVQYINYKIKHAENSIREKLKSRVDIAHDIASNIYNENIDHLPIDEIKEIIKDALRPIQFDSEQGCYFIVSLNAYQILSPGEPELEGKYVFDLKDDLGNFVVKDELNVVQSMDEGFVINYWTRPGSDTSMFFKKISYVKQFEPLNWYIGTGSYEVDFEAQVQKEVLQWLSNYRFGNEGYVFVNTYEGDALLMDGTIVKEKKNVWDLKDPNGIKVIQDERRAVKNPDGDFIYYSWKKLNASSVNQKTSFVKGIPEWKWMVGSGVYIDEIDQILEIKKKEISQSVKQDVFIIIISLCVLFILIYFVAFYLSKKATNNINSFIRFFKNASSQNIFIDESTIHFSEYKILANSANKMIAEIKESEIRNQEEEAHSKKLFTESPEAIAFLNSQAQVQRVNPAFTKLFGYEISEIQNKDLDDFIVPFELKEEASGFTERFIKGFNDQIEVIRITKNKQKVHVSIIGTPVSVYKHLLGFYVIYRNISEQKEFEKQLYDSKTKAEESDRLKTSFLTNLSHEIRTPLNAIIGFSTLLNMKEISKEDQKEYLKIMGNSGKLLLEIIDHIIDISKIESSTLSINKTKTNLNTLIDELFLDYIEFKNNMKLDRIVLKIHKQFKDRELFILTDYKRIKQVYSNLLDNALKFTEKGIVEFGYAVEDQKIICFVKDTGIGIDKNELQFVFDRFRQADESNTRKYGGTGIGLALCKSLVELLGGKLWAKSEKKIGSEFYFSIPLDVVTPSIKKLTQSKPIENINWSAKKILIAEDIETNFKLLFSFLSKTQVKIFWAKDGKEAISMVDKNPDYDLILMDINMPIMNGHEALKYLNDKGYKIPVIAQTAYATDEHSNEILDLGYQDYILKPITLERLLHKLSKFLD